MRRTRTSRAFTLVELLVVLSVVVLALAVILPAFSRIIASNNYASAVNAVTATLQRAASAGVDGGVVFLWDHHRQRLTLQQVQVLNPDATLLDDNAGVRVPAIAYMPTPGQPPVELPPGTGVFGLSFLHDDPSDNANPVISNNAFAFARWYEREVAFYNAGPNAGRIEVNNWLFPRNHVQFFLNNWNPENPTDPNAPPNNANTAPGSASSNLNRFLFADSFFIRFSADGEAMGSSSASGAPRDAYLEFPNFPASELTPQQAQSLNERDDLFDPFNYHPGGATGPNAGPPVYNPEVHLRPVDQIAITDLDALSRAINVPKPWLLRAQGVTTPPAPTALPASYIADPGENPVGNPPASVITRLNNWIDANAQIITFTRYTGQTLKK